MAAILIRRKKAQRQSLSVEEEDVDTRPMYLKTFPSESLILKDLKLSVLLGRY
jgi:hypothetical protein